MITLNNIKKSKENKEKREISKRANNAEAAIGRKLDNIN